MPSRTDESKHASPNLLRPVFAEQLSNEPPKSDKHGISGATAVVHSDDLDTQEREYLMDLTQVGYIARQPIKSLNNEHVERPEVRLGKQRQQSRTTSNRCP
ncbi:hypothetical protein BO1005MUT1_260002 [Hyphomicrobiales bacterium]|nr:hypothetical protein BO1005MUT1_260002 [Hyphomicrobiales bacterium]